MHVESTPLEMISEKYKFAEKTLRTVKNLAELEEARKFLPSDFRLHTDPETDPIELCPNVFLFRGMIDETAQIELTRHIVLNCIDEPHSNSLSAPGPLWDEYRNICESSPNELHAAGLRKLRWACMGFHYDWTHRRYCPSQKSDFPLTDPIQTLYRRVAGKPAESVIINFYHTHRPGDRLGGHRDDCEASLSPLLLVSLGVPGLLLLGDDCGVLLRSGDAILMKDEGRLTLHGLPCVFSGSSAEADGSVEDLLSRTRISLSIRCVW